jgi:hypothetical protein
MRRAVADAASEVLEDGRACLDVTTVSACMDATTERTRRRSCSHRSSDARHGWSSKSSGQTCGGSQPAMARELALSQRAIARR